MLWRINSWDQSDQTLYWHPISIHKDLIIIIFVTVFYFILFFQQNLGDNGNDKEENFIPVFVEGNVNFFFFQTQFH